MADTRSTLIGSGLTLIGTLAGYGLSAYQSTLSHDEKTQAALAQQVQTFAETQQAEASSLQSTDSRSVKLALTTLFELANATTDSRIRTQQKEAVIVIGGTIGDKDVQDAMYVLYSGDAEATKILNSSKGIVAKLALYNAKLPSSSQHTDPGAQPTIIPQITITGRATLSQSGWLYLGRGTVRLADKSVPILNHSSNIEGPTGTVPLPKVGDKVTLARDVNLRESAPTNASLGAVIGILPKGTAVKILALKYLEFNSQDRAEWAQVSASSQ